MKNLKPRTRPTAEEALAIATQTAPTQPPARMNGEDRATTLNLRFRETSVAAITDAAASKGLTIKQIVARALDDAGVAIAPLDLEDRTPRRKSEHYRRGRLSVTP